MPANVAQPPRFREDNSMQFVCSCYAKTVLLHQAALRSGGPDASPPEECHPEANARANRPAAPGLPATGGPGGSETRTAECRAQVKFASPQEAETQRARILLS